jgi:predicted short-subunit dehydrogenase-like oxidoreductase (DUF2520 family)
MPSLTAVGEKSFSLRSKDTGVPPSIQDIIIIGTGNAAHVLGRLLVRKGYRVVQVYGRNFDAAHMLARELQADAIKDPKELSTQAQLCIVAVSDSALQQVTQWLPTMHSPVVHTAGSMSLDLLKPLNQQVGVFYPLQTLRANDPVIPQIPFLVEASNQAFQDGLQALGHRLSGMAMVMDAENRRRMHLAAVTTHNFFNHLSALSFDFLHRHQLVPQLLMPLLEETLRRMKTANPAQMQTGPAIRGDAGTMALHESMLSQDPLLQKLYPLISESIQRYYHIQTDPGGDIVS